MIPKDAWPQDDYFSKNSCWFYVDPAVVSLTLRIIMEIKPEWITSASLEDETICIFGQVKKIADGS